MMDTLRQRVWRHRRGRLAAGRLVEAFDEAQRRLNEERVSLRGAWSGLRGADPELTLAFDETQRKFVRSLRRLDWEAAIEALRAAFRATARLWRLDAALRSLETVRRERERLSRIDDSASPARLRGWALALVAEATGRSFLAAGGAGAALGALAVESHYLVVLSSIGERSGDEVEESRPTVSLVSLADSLNLRASRVERLAGRLQTTSRES